MRRFGPKPADAPDIGQCCPICDHAFVEGDFTTLVAVEAANEEEEQRRLEGRYYTARAEQVCWDHAKAIAFVTGQTITLPGEERKQEERGPHAK